MLCFVMYIHIHAMSSVVHQQCSVCVEHLVHQVRCNNPPCC